MVSQSGVLETWRVSTELDGRNGDEGLREEDRKCGNMTSGEATAIK